MSDELLRYETNTKVRQILVSYNVDMMKINYSCSKKTIYIYGFLNKQPYGEFTVSDIKNMVAELMKLHRVRDVQFDLENWFISAETGELCIIKGKRPAVYSKQEDQ
jgi:hypothetical protein